MNFGRVQAYPVNAEVENFPLLPVLSEKSSTFALVEQSTQNIKNNRLKWHVPRSHRKQRWRYGAIAHAETLAARKIIKLDMPQTLWREFGIDDKR